MTEAPSVRVEHHALHAHLDAIGDVADSIGEITVEKTRARVENVYDFLARHIRPHMRAEDQVLYPLLDRLIGTPSATAALRRDHAEIVSFVDELAAIRHTLADAPLDQGLIHRLRRTLYGLHLLLTMHFAKEDELYYPFLEQRLEQAAADDLARRMQDVTLGSA